MTGNGERRIEEGVGGTLPGAACRLCSFFNPPYGVLWAAAIVVTLVLAAANLFLAEPNQDEGWYLYAARLVSQGQKPYLDFACTQGPVMPFVYALAQPLVDRWGVAGGRLFTILIGLLCCAGTAFLAARLSPPGKRNAAAFVAFALVAVNVYQSQFFTIVKTYALTALFLVLGLAALTFAGRRRGWVAALLSGILLSLAAGTRLSAVVVLPVVFLGLAWEACGRMADGGWRMADGGRRKSDGGSQMADGGEWGAAIGLAAGAAATLAIVFLPFWVKAPGGLWFALVEYHAGRETGGLAPALAYKAGFISRVVQDYFVAIAILLFAVAVFLGSRKSEVGSRKSAGNGGSAFLWVLGISVAAVTAVHLIAPFPYDDYQVMIFPAFAAGVAVGLVRIMEMVYERRAAATVLLLCVASAFSSPVNQNWFIGQRDRIWWPVKEHFPMAALQEAGRHIRSITKPDDLLLTQDAYLAVESGRRLPPGMELGPFCYFPGWSREKASARHVLNREMLVELLRNGGAPVAAFSGWGLALRSPDIRELSREEQRSLRDLVEGNYELDRTIEAFGHAETTLKIYRRKREP